MLKNDNIAQENLKFSYKSRHLPHMFDVDKPSFITYRINFTLPKHLIEEYNRRRTGWYAGLQVMDDNEKAETIDNKDARFFSWFDDLLAKSDGTPQILHREDLTAIISESLKYHDTQRYHLLAYCIMPNHVHVLIYPVKQSSGLIYSPQHIIYTWKKYAATQINRVLNRKGSLWQKESYDRIIRDEKELYQTVNYIINNPVKAGLVEDWRQWLGTYVCAEFYRE